MSSGQQQSVITKKKSKCRGNRPLQRFRRQCRAKGLNADTIAKLVLTKTSLHACTGHMLEEKDQAMADILNRDNRVTSASKSTPVNQICSSSKYQCIEGDWSSMIQHEPERQGVVPSTRFDRSKPRHSTLSIDHWKQSPSMVPQYQKMGRSLLRESLANALPDHRNDVMEWLANSKVFKFVKQQIHQAALIHQHEIELNYWNSVADAAAPVLALLSKEPPGFTRKNYIPWDYPQTMKNIQHRQQVIRNTLGTCEKPWNHYSKRSTCLGITQASLSLLRQASENLIQAAFRQFSLKLNEKLVILDYDIHDIELVKSFYDLLPDREQIDAVKCLWRLKYRSGKRATIRGRMANKDQITANTCHGTARCQAAIKLTDELISTSMRSIVHARLRNIEKRKDRIHTFQEKQLQQQLA